MNHGNGIWAVPNPDHPTKPKFGAGAPYEADDCGGSEVSAGSFEVGKRYKISAVGTSTRWQSLGARASDLGTTFVATAAGGSTTDGKAELVECPLQAVDTPDVNGWLMTQHGTTDDPDWRKTILYGEPDGVITDDEKAAYVLYDICSCYHDTGAGQISNEICGELAQSVGQVLFIYPFFVCCRGHI